MTHVAHRHLSAHQVAPLDRAGERRACRALGCHTPGNTRGVRDSPAATTDERLPDLARTRLADHSYVDAMNALIDVTHSTELPIPDDLLVQAARGHLETVDAGRAVDPCRVLRELAVGA
jgi:hypothetical protein